MPLAMSEKDAVPLSAATTRYGSSPSRRTTCCGTTTLPSTRLSVMSSSALMKVRYDATPSASHASRPSIRRIREAFRKEATLGADRDDDRVLNCLGLDQPENFGTEVFASVRPAQAAPGDGTESQMNALDTR